MNVDTEKVDEAVLGLLYLTLHDGARAWKSLDWAAMGRLYAKGLICDPANKAKSVALSDAGLEAAQRLCRRLFTRVERAPPVSVRYGSAIAQANAADGVSGLLCRDATTGRYFFRQTGLNDEVTDFELRHDDLPISIAPDAMAAFYHFADQHVLDHNPQVLGLSAAGAPA